MKRLVLLGLSSLVAVSSGCLAYNQDCSAPADLVDPDQIIGYLAQSMTVKRATVRTQETAFGDLVADADADAFDNPQNPSYRAAVPPVDAAFENAGGIRDEGFCAPVESLPGAKTDPPPIHRVDLREVFPFTNRVVVVELTGAELYQVLEHSVSALGDPKDPARGFFLQVSSGLSFAADCAKTAQQVSSDGLTITTPGQRVSSVTVGGQPVSRTDTTTIYRIATNDFLIQPSGNDGFATLAGRIGKSSLGKFGYEVAEDYLRLSSSKASPYVAPKVGGRITLVNCK